MSTITHLRRLLNGDVGLAKTFWIFNILVNIIVSIGIWFATDANATIPFFVFVIFSVIWTPIILISIWRAATKYAGNRVWAILAKVWVVMDALVHVVNISVSIFAFSGYGVMIVL